ncbi:MAG: PAS domain S-box protein, partial [Deltaproteobacteria bacterium]|nr:PAS domain S-box protein [Deltaproteobacteria bacterium]
MQGKKKKKIHFDISVWVAISAIAVLAVILSLMIFMQFQQRKDQAVTLFVEKGATLIQSFEAGLRDRLNRDEDMFYLRKLLMETAQQPDIDYMIVTDSKGQILADSDPSMLGRPYGLDLDMKKIAGNLEVRWRQAANPEGAGTFEVYRGFSPRRAGDGKGDRRPSVVFVGFNMEKIEKASREDTIRTVTRALVLVLIGSLAIVSLFLVQAYRLARSSLSRITVFSEALVKHMPIGLLAVDKHGRIVACNEQANEFFTGSCPEATGREAGDLLPVPFSMVLDKINDQTALIEEDIAISSEKDGNQMWEVVAAAFADDDVHEGKILLARNVTAIRQLEQEVARSRHLNAIGSLAAGVAHEIRNPLSSIKGFAVYFKQRLSGNKEDEETADIMIAETERLNRVISQLIEFARPLTLKREPTSLTDLVRHTIRLVEAEAKKNAVEIDVKAGENLPQADIDPDKIKQVLLNIFLNALSAMPAGGRLLLELSAQKDWMDVAVSDTGSGIKEEDLPRIYDPYFTSKPAGTGLGLAVVQKIMDAHGGLVQMES